MKLFYSQLLCWALSLFVDLLTGNDIGALPFQFFKWQTQKHLIVFI
jgi:hypothetical protein